MCHTYWNTMNEVVLHSRVSMNHYQILPWSIFQEALPNASVNLSEALLKLQWAIIKLKTNLYFKANAVSYW